MTNKLEFLTKMSLKKKMKTKWFAAANILLFLVIIAVINIDTIIKSFGGEFETKTNIIVVDNTGRAYEDFKATYQTYASEYSDLKNTSFNNSNKSIDDLKKDIEASKDKEIIVIINRNSENYLDAEIITKDKINALNYQVMVTALNNAKRNIALEENNISPVLINRIDSPINVTRTLLNNEKSTDEMMELVMSVVLPIVILPFFMLTMFLVQMIGAEVNEEKTTKSMEIIISNVSPRTHFISKVLSANIFVITQGILLFVYSGIGLLVRRLTVGSFLGGEAESYIGDIVNSLNETGIINNIGYIIIITLVLMLVTFLAYSLLAGVLASMTTNMEDYQQVQTPIMLISVAGYYLAIMAAMFEGSLFIRIVSYIPFISALLAPSLLFLGQITIVDVLISLAIMIGLIWFLFKYGMKIYKVGILNYSSKNLWKKMFKAARN